MRRFISIALIVGLLAIGTLLALPVPRTPDGAFDDLTGDAKRGAYIARLGGCFACHTDAKSGGAVLAGGGPIKTPFGTFYAPNITMHKADGIGAWSLVDFDQAMRNGVSPDGGHYFPAFPYAYYSKLSDQELIDLWAAFQTVPPAADGPPPHELGFPFNQRFLLRAWKMLFFDPGPLVHDPGRTAEWNRGRYLVEGPGHCSACHTPRNLLGGSRNSLSLEGGVGPDNERIPPISTAALKKSGYTPEELAIALKTGITPKGDALGGSMKEVISGATRWWTAEDLAAVAEFLMNGSAVSTPK